jgi:hypothetical protein
MNARTDPSDFAAFRTAARERGPTRAAARFGLSRPAPRRMASGREARLGPPRLPCCDLGRCRRDSRSRGTRGSRPKRLPHRGAATAPEMDRRPQPGPATSGRPSGSRSAKPRESRLHRARHRCRPRGGTVRRDRQGSVTDRAGYRLVFRGGTTQRPAISLPRSEPGLRRATRRATRPRRRTCGRPGRPRDGSCPLPPRRGSVQ